jgi:glycosyltransferase involved in cell wall biosynthesis
VRDGSTGRSVRLFLAGPLVGRNPGWPQSQGEILEDHLVEDGYEVHSSSKHPSRLPRLADTMFSLLRHRRDFDLLIVMVYSGRAFYMAEWTAALGKRLNKPIVLWFHGGNLPSFVERHQKRADRLIGRSEKVVVPSAYLGRMTGPDSVTIPNIVDIDRYPFGLREKVAPRLLWMRTFNALYNPRMAVRVLGRIIERFPDASLTMAGQDQGELAAVKELVVREGLTEHVRFAGFLDHEAKRREFESHDIYLHTNKVDNMPVSLLEAAAFGLPIVGSRVGGVPDMFSHGRSALLVSEGDEEGMSFAVQRLVDEPNLARDLSASARLVAEASAWEKVAPLWDDVFTTVMGEAS